MVRFINVYKQFECIADKCTDSCCAGWKIIVDEHSAKKYRDYQGELGEKLKHKMLQDKNIFFELNKGRCPFLNSGNLCDIYIEMGKDMLCETCSSYPRIIRQEDDIMQVCLTMSCPEAARLMMSDKFKIIEIDNGKALDCISMKDRMQQLLIQIIEDERTKLFNRIITAMMVTNAVAREKKEEKIVEIIEQFEDSDMRNDFTTSVTLEDIGETAFIVYDLVKEFIKIYDTRVIRKDIIERVKLYLGEKNEFAEKYIDMLKNLNDYMHKQNKSYVYQNQIIYYIFRHYKDKCSRNEFLTMMSVYCVISRTIHALVLENEGEIGLEDIIIAYQYYSKLIEHSVKDYNKMLRFMQESSYNRLSVLAGLVSFEFNKE